MSIRIAARKFAIPAMKTLAIAFAVAVGTSGSAMAASEEPSFITRVQASQGVGPSGMVARGDQASAMARASVVSEAASFITRVEMSQGIDQARYGATSEESARSSVPGEATSFIIRVEASQGIAPFQNRS